MYKLKGKFAEDLTPVEVLTFANACVSNANALEFFQLCQDALWTLIENKGKIVSIPKDYRGLKLITFQISTRVLTLAQAAMRLGMAGYAPEALALSRVISELTRVNTYLAFFQDQIENYLGGKLKVTEILKRERKLHENKNNNPQYEMWKFLSNFSHGTADLLKSFNEQKGERHTVQVLIVDKESVESIVYGTVTLFFAQYGWFRLVFRNMEIPHEVIEMDNKIFLSDLGKSLFKDEFVQKTLPEMHKAIYGQLL